MCRSLAGLIRTRFGRPSRDRGPVIERDVGVGLVSDRGQVQHGVARAAERHVERHRVAYARRVHDLSGSDTLGEQLHHTHAGLLRKANTLRVDRGDGAVARQPDADRLDEAVHRVGGEQPCARAARRAGVIFEHEQVLLGHRARSHLADRREHRVEVDRLALGSAASEHRPAADDHRRQVESCRRHEHPGNDLVAVGDHDHRVERVGANGDLDRVGDDLATRERVAHAGVVHRDAVAHADGRHLERCPARHVDARLHRVGDSCRA